MGQQPSVYRRLRGVRVMEEGVLGKSPKNWTFVQITRRWMGLPFSRWVAFGCAFISTLWIFVALLRPDLSFRHKQPPDLLPQEIYTPPPASVSPGIWPARAAEVKDAFRHAYYGYRKYASNYDELQPVTGGKANKFNGWNLSVVESLDTMWIMELYDDFRDAIPIVAQTSFETTSANFFETVIRYLGGLLSAYSLSGEPIFLARADELGGKLLPVFNSSSGLPWSSVNTITGSGMYGWARNVLLSEFMSCQMEYKYLAHLTGRTKYYEKVEKVMQIMKNATVELPGLLPISWSIASGQPADSHFSVGARADSAYEYMLKQWLLSGKSEGQARDLYLAAADGIIKNLLYLSPTRKLLYVTDIYGGKPSHVFEHLSCFLPGLFALAAHTLPLPPRDMVLHKLVAVGLAKTCWTTYIDQATGIGPDEMTMTKWDGKDPHAGRWLEHFERWERDGKVGLPPGLQDVPPATSGNRDYYLRRTSYFLRPETVESFFLLWKTTGDEVWRERGWTMFQSLQKHARTEYGYASVSKVDEIPAPLLNEMPSYFLAETLKYLYLLFTDADLIPLDKFVFNTEAHPLPVFQWSAWEKQKYDIQS